MVHADSPRAVAEALAALAARGIARAVIQPHVSGDLVKFYGIGTAGRALGARLVPLVLPQGSDLGRASAGSRAAGRLARAAAAALGLEVYGGDAIATADGRLVLLDLNAWPSFALYRDEAARRHRQLPRPALRAGAPMSERREVGPRSKAVVAQERRHHRPRSAGVRAVRGSGHGPRRGLHAHRRGWQHATSTSSRASPWAASATAILTTWRRSSSKCSGSPSGASPLETRAKFLELLASVTPEGLTRIQMFSGGAEAVEAALRLAKAATGKHEVLGVLGRLSRQDERGAALAREAISSTTRARSCPVTISPPMPTATAVRSGSATRSAVSRAPTTSAT